jgi:polysaccharide pyruvyl transferase WcaK-like protein
MHASRITLVTKTRTQNQGNQALSIAWRDYLQRRFPASHLTLLDRGPRFLKRYRVSDLARERDPVAAFDRIARDLSAKASGAADSDPAEWEVLHEPRLKQAVRFLWLRRALRVRSRIAALSVGRDEYFGRLAYLQGADLVVVNPAGEFYTDAQDTALHYLIETRCAQLAGCRTAFVNLSFEVTDPLLIRLSDHVFAHCDVLEFRDQESVAHFTNHGGRKTPIVVPDAALLSSIERPTPAGGRGLGLAINALQVASFGLQDAWDALVAELARQGPITLTSNEWTTDFPFWKRYLARAGVTCDGQHLAYADYARFLAQFDVLVSSRLHTCILGLVAGAAVVPVETGTFKLTGFFNQIGMPDEPIRVGQHAWQTKLLQRIEAVRADGRSRRELQDKHVMAAKNTMRSELDGVFLPSLVRGRVEPPAAWGPAEARRVG